MAWTADKLLTDWARQGMLQLCHWLPGRRIVFVGDASFAVHRLAHALARIPAFVMWSW